MRLLAIEAVFELGRPTNDDRSEGMINAFVLKAWTRLLPPQEAISRTAEICDRVLNNPKEDQVALFFASAGQVSWTRSAKLWNWR